MRHLSGGPKANVVILGNFNEGQPVGNRRQLSHSQLAKFTSWLPAEAPLLVGFPEIGGEERPRQTDQRILPEAL